MRKKYLFVAAAAAMLAACSSKDSIESAQNGGLALPSIEQGSVGFDAYAQRGVTRGGMTGIMTTDRLKLSQAQKGGFGVFAYYTDNNDYEQSRIPDFMYNQGVFWNGNNWEYTPIKYWPNEYGSNATSDDYDRVSYFAYAPYVGTNGNGKILKETGSDEDKWGITGMTRNSTAGDPIIKYIGSFEADKSVDLLWGVCNESGWKLIQDGSSQQINEGIKGLPWLNVQRPFEAATQADAQQRIKFTFEHALTQLSVNIDAIVDEISKGSNTLAAETKIYVRQISFTGVALKGSLNLNNDQAHKALWLDYSGVGDIESGTPIVLYDGLKDGKEGTIGSNASNEKTRGLNPEVMSNEGNTTAGVTNETKPLFATDPVMLIPTGEDMEIEIVYDVETEDANLSTLLSDGKTHGSSIENRIKKTVKFASYDFENGMESGKHYTVNLHLGMNSVKFDVAAVTDWVDVETNIDVDLPSNDGASVGAVGNVLTQPLSAFTPVAIDAFAQDYSFAVTGLKAGEALTTQLQGELPSYDALIKNGTPATYTVGSAPGASDNVASEAGIAYVTINFTDNQTVHPLSPAHFLLIEGQESLKGTKALFTQEAQQFGLQVQDVQVSGDNDQITIAATNTLVTDAASAISEGTISDDDLSYGWATDFNGISLKINGTEYTKGTAVGDNTFTYDNSGNIAIQGHLVAGDKVEIKITASDKDGNAEANTETVKFIVGGIKFAAGTKQTLTYSTQPQNALVPTMVGVTADELTYDNGGASEFTITDNQITTNTILADDDPDDDTDNEVTVSVTKTNTAGSDYFYTNSSCSASYDLVINAQTTTTSFTRATDAVANLDKANGTLIYDFDSANQVTVTANDEAHTVITAPAATIEIVSVTVNGVAVDDPSTLFSVSSMTITAAAELQNGVTYRIVVRASYAGDTDHYAASNSENFTLDATTVTY